MKALTLQEFAEDMRRKGDIRNADLADEILGLIDIEADVAEPYSKICDYLSCYVPQTLQDEHVKAVEWLGDRSNLLTEIEEQLEKAGHAGDVDDVIKKLCEDLVEAREVLAENGLREYDL